VRTGRVGPLTLAGPADRAVLGHVDVLKLAEEEAHALVGKPTAASLSTLGVPEVVVTAGSRGALVWSDARLRQVPARPPLEDVDPTGAGDAFAALYLAARLDGAPPLAAAESAAELVAQLLSSTARTRRAPRRRPTRRPRPGR
jgi:sugar/nucleoside kinase (ribokinase family)